MNAVGKLARYTLHSTLSPVLKDKAQRNLAVSSTMTGMKGVGLYWCLRIVGLDPSPLLAVFGMVGAAVGFAGKDLVSNFISGATIAASNSLREGDKITINSGSSSAVSGVLIDMDMKYLYLEQADGTLLMVPNSLATTSVVAITKGAERKRVESEKMSDVAGIHHPPLSAEEEKAEALQNLRDARRGKHVLYLAFTALPCMAFCVMIGFVACGLISEDDVRGWFADAVATPQKMMAGKKEEPTIAADDAANSSRMANFILGLAHRVRETSEGISLPAIPGFTTSEADKK